MKANLRSTLTLLVALPCLSACGGSADEPECNDLPMLPATNADAMFEFGSCRGYIDWPAESSTNPTTAPHGAATRVFINPAFETSLQAGNTEHPVGAASYKEIYRNDALIGWAAMIKVAAGTGADSWYWYEVLNTAPGSSPVAASAGAPVCANCHEAGSDYFLTTFPLR